MVFFIPKRNKHLNLVMSSVDNGNSLYEAYTIQIRKNRLGPITKNNLLNSFILFHADKVVIK